MDKGISQHWMAIGHTIVCCCRELFLFDRRYTAKNYWPSKILSLTGIIGQDY